MSNIIEFNPRVIAFDTETFGLYVHQGHKPFLIILSRYRANGHLQTGLFYEKDFHRAKRILEDRRYRKVAHNSGFDKKMLRAVGIEVVGRCDDTMLMAYVCDSDLEVGLAKVAERFTDEKKQSDEIKSWFRKNKIVQKDWDFSKVPREIMDSYAAVDGRATLKAYWPLRQRVIDRGLIDIYHRELYLVDVLIRMNDAGVCVDTAYLLKLKAGYEVSLLEHQRQLEELTPQGFNSGSPLQLSRFFKDLGYELPKSQKGNDTVNMEVLNGLEHPVAKLITDIRHTEKFKTTYVDGILEACTYYDTIAKAHPEIRQTSAVTGRTGSSHFAIQTIPKEGGVIRRALIPSPGNKLILVDYSQQEIRIYAGYAQNAELFHMIENGLDIHKRTMEEGNIDRTTAKKVNFASLYGAGKNKISEILGISTQKAAEAVAAFHKSFPDARRLINEIREVLANRGYIQNRYGRKYFMSSDKSYLGLNYLIQGSGADMCKGYVMPALDRFLSDKKTKMISFIHDELVFDWDPTEDIVPEIKRLMEGYAAPMRIALPVEVSVAHPSWADKRPYTPDEVVR